MTKPKVVNCYFQFQHGSTSRLHCYAYTFYAHKHKRASKQTWFRGYSGYIWAHEHEQGGILEGARGRMKKHWVKASKLTSFSVEEIKSFNVVLLQGEITFVKDLCPLNQ